MRRSKAIETIKATMFSKEISQKELAGLAGISEPTVSRCLSGELLISKEVAEAIAPALGIDRATLVELAFLDRLERLKPEYEGYSRVQLRLDIAVDGLQFGE